MIDGWLGLNAWQCIVTVMVMTHITIASVTMYLHRSQAHRSVDFHPLVNHFFRSWLWMTTGMRTKDWVSIHRKHHAKCETQEDPHSPQVLGLKKVLWEGAELYRAEAKNLETMERYGHGTPNDWIEKYLYNKAWLGITLMFILDVLLFGVKGISVWGVQMIWIPFFAAGVINGVGHAIGYRNFESPDASTNLIPWGILIGGEELHNNHHTYPTSARLSLKWYEFDIGWLYIRLLSILKLAKVRRVAPKVALSNSPGSTLCENTLKSLLSNRFQVMTYYSHTVLKPALLKAQTHANAQQKRMLNKLKHSWGKLSEVDLHGLSRFPQLKTEIELKKSLQRIWDQKNASAKELIDQLSLWCEQAKATQNKTLEQFVEYLNRYQVQAS
ncbi:MAG: acyl-CoA desaturase [Legionellales bacterium]|nr:acyl-CoA desaturase [Legionellales bacterium]